MEFLSNNLDTVLLIVIIAAKVLQWIAPKTENEIDDKISAGVNWALRHANSIFSIVEDLGDMGLIKTSKSEVYREKLNEQYFKIYGKRLPDAAIAEAEVVAAGLAAEDHKIKRITAGALAVEPNPQPAPAAQG